MIAWLLNFFNNPLVGLILGMLFISWLIVILLKNPEHRPEEKRIR